MVLFFVAFVVVIAMGIIAWKLFDVIYAFSDFFGVLHGQTSFCLVAVLKPAIVAVNLFLFNAGYAKHRRLLKVFAKMT